MLQISVEKSEYTGWGLRLKVDSRHEPGIYEMFQV